MMSPEPEETYLNPVYRHACPDPFVLKHRGEYWAYCTGIWKDGRCFGVLHSTDLVHWNVLGGALEQLQGELTSYWAPETFYENGLFYLYYSAGNEERMQIRVALADHPAGPFIDSGHALTQEPFAIDAHVFVDEDGYRYLFYATDFLDHTPIGTGTRMDRLLTPFMLAGESHAVTRARYDWQVYDPHRIEKGGVRWHTIEGPFVLKHKGRYYQMFSGGNWQNPTYGVSYATSSQIDRSGEWDQFADGVCILPILRTLPEHGVIGPGHNSVVRGPDNRQFYCIYHRWIENQQPDRVEQVRALAIDRMEWIGEGLTVVGPSHAPQPIPLRPSIVFFTGYGMPEGSTPSLQNDSPSTAPFPGDWQVCDGRWEIRQGMAVQADSRPGGLSEARLSLPSPSFLLEVSLGALFADQRNPGAFGITLDGVKEEVISLELLPRTGSRAGTSTAIVATGSGETRREDTLDLPTDFASQALHLARLEVNGAFASLALDGIPRWSGQISASPMRAVLFTRGMAACFSAFELTNGFEDQFTIPFPDLHILGWEALNDAQGWTVREGQLWHTNPNSQASIIARGPAFEAFELVVNVRLQKLVAPQGGYGFTFLPEFSELIRPTLSLQRTSQEGNTGGWELVWQDSVSPKPFRMPTGFDPFDCQQFRLTCKKGRLNIQWKEEDLGNVEMLSAPARIGLVARHALLAVDMVRMTEIG